VPHIRQANRLLHKKPAGDKITIQIRSVAEATAAG